MLTRRGELSLRIEQCFNAESYDPPSAIGPSLPVDELNSTNLTLAKSLSFIPNRAWILFLVSAKTSFYG